MGEFTLDLGNTSLHKGKTVFHLTPKEAKLMAVLMEHVGQVVSRAKLKREVWHMDEAERDNSRALDVYIRWLRQKVEDNPRIPEHILTRRGMGYELRIDL
jgi:DNA-binding response OmpR family regulator